MSDIAEVLSVGEQQKEIERLRDDIERLKGIIQTERDALCEWEHAFNQIARIAGQRRAERDK